MLKTLLFWTAGVHIAFFLVYACNPFAVHIVNPSTNQGSCSSFICSLLNGFINFFAGVANFTASLFLFLTFVCLHSDVPVQLMVIANIVVNVPWALMLAGMIRGTNTPS